jgi:hypothetical protein
MADEVLFRAAQKVAVGEQVDDINRYVYGIARFVRLESFRRPKSDSIDDMGAGSGDRQRGVPDPLRVAPVVFDDETDGAAYRCLRLCVSSLSQDNRNLILSYYAADETGTSNIEQRKVLAKRLGKSMGTLQKQVCLLRQKVAGCTKDCVEGKR